MHCLIIDFRLIYPILSFFLQEQSEQVSKDIISNHFFDKFVVVFLPLEESLILSNPVFYTTTRNSNDFTWSQVTEECFAKIFRNVFCISQSFRSLSFLSSRSFWFLKNINFFVRNLFFPFILIVTIICRCGILSLSCQCAVRRHAQGIVVLNVIFLIFVENLSILFDSVASHLTEMILNLEFSGVFTVAKREIELVLILPVESFERKLLLGKYFFWENTVWAYNLELVWGVHKNIIAYS